MTAQQRVLWVVTILLMVVEVLVNLKVHFAVHSLWSATALLVSALATLFVAISFAMGPRR